MHFSLLIINLGSKGFKNTNIMTFDLWFFRFILHKKSNNHDIRMIIVFIQPQNLVWMLFLHVSMPSILWDMVWNDIHVARFFNVFPMFFMNFQQKPLVWFSFVLFPKILGLGLRPLSPAHVARLSPSQPYGRVWHAWFLPKKKKCFFLFLRRLFQTHP